jgi:23S rRNA pseudouridine1911/1915/1917 synthase
VRKRVLTVAVGDPPQLDRWLAARLPPEPGADPLPRAREHVAQGAVHVDGRRCLDPSTPLRPGQRLTIFLAAPPASLPPLHVIHRDRHLLVIEKPSGVPTQATHGTSREALDERVRCEIDADARPLHRLDRDASGLVLFARPEARARLQAAMAAGAIDRRYIAIVSPRLDGEGRINLRIGRDPTDRRRRTALPERAPSGEAAASRWRVRAHTGDRAALELTLETGRTHQLRVHLAAIGHPILGDRLYGGDAAERLCLHAHQLTVPDPPQPARTFTSEVPALFHRLVPGLTTDAG